MPANVKPGQIVSLVQITDDHAPTIALPRLAHELHADIAVLLPIIDAAEMLGLVERQKGELTLTDLGLRFQKPTRNFDRIRLIKDELAKIEPFKTSLDLANQKT
jgi:NitT/TauT family transport system ATP-binding protein